MFFRCGEWMDGYAWHDPAWSSAIRHRADALLWQKGGVSEESVAAVETAIYSEFFSGVARKQHDTPQYEEKDNRVKKESGRRGTARGVGHRKYPAQ
jgi:hypothetical protein